MAQQGQPIPSPTWPLVGPDGRVTDIWFRFLSALFSRTGGSVGNGVGPGLPPADLSSLQAAVGALQGQIPALQTGLAEAEVLAATGDDVGQSVADLRAGLDAVVSGLADVRVMVATLQEPDAAQSQPDVLALVLLGEG